MADPQEPEPVPQQGAGPDISGGGGYSFNPAMMYGMMMGGGGLGMQDPWMATLQPQALYAQQLLRQGTEASPVTSPWQAVARAVQGTLGGLGLRRYGEQASGLLEQESAQAQALGGQAMEELRKLYYGVTPQAGAPQPQAAPPVAPAAPGGAGPPAGAAAPVGPVQKVQLYNKGLGTTAPGDYDALITKYAAMYGIPKQVAVGLFSHENAGFDPTLRNKETGATGLGQVLPSTAQKPGFDIAPLADNNADAIKALSDPETNIKFSLQYLAAQGKDKYGDMWNPQNNEQMKNVLKYYGGYYDPDAKTFKQGADGYANAVFVKGGILKGTTDGRVVPPNTAVAADGTVALPPAPTGAAAAATPAADQTAAIAADPKLNRQAGIDTYMRLQQVAMQMVSSGNPFARAQAQQVIAMANQALQYGRFDTVQGPGGSVLQRDAMTGKLSPVLGAQRYDMYSANQMQALGNKYQAGQLGEAEKPGLDAALNQLYGPGTDAQTSAFKWTNNPPAWVVRYAVERGIAPKSALAGLPTAEAGAPGAPAPAALHAWTEGLSPEAIKSEFDQLNNRAAAAYSTLGDEQKTVDAQRAVMGQTQVIRNLLDGIKTGPGTAGWSAAKDFIERWSGKPIPKDVMTDATSVQVAQNQFLNMIVRTMPGLIGKDVALPGVEQGPAAIEMATRLIDANQQYLQDRQDARANWVGTQEQLARSGQPGHRPGDFRGLANFSQSGWDAQNSPKIYNAAAMWAATAGKDPKAFAGLTKDQARQARIIASRIWSGETERKRPGE